MEHALKNVTHSFRSGHMGRCFQIVRDTGQNALLAGLDIEIEKVVPLLIQRQFGIYRLDRGKTYKTVARNFQICDVITICHLQFFSNENPFTASRSAVFKKMSKFQRIVFSFLQELQYKMKRQYCVMFGLQSILQELAEDLTKMQAVAGYVICILNKCFFFSLLGGVGNIKQ